LFRSAEHLRWALPLGKSELYAMVRLETDRPIAGRSRGFCPRSIALRACFIAFPSSLAVIFNGSSQFESFDLETLKIRDYRSVKDDVMSFNVAQ
jgi:hypothetical protein